MCPLFLGGSAAYLSIAPAIVIGVLGDFPLTSRMGFTIFHNRNTPYRACEICRACTPVSVFLPFLRLFFTLLRDLELCDFCLYCHGSASILLDLGAVMVLGGRQSDETVCVGIGGADF